MLVFGDHDRRETPAAKLDRIDASLADAARETGIARHATLVIALIEAGELAQGLADSAFEARGRVDGESEPAHRAMALALALADCVAASWSDRDPANSRVAALGRLAELRALQLPATLAVRDPEGFAHYAVYPESYLEAARAAALGPDTQVIGLRSIGTTLAAVVAAAAGAPCPVTLRPVGHPFHRELALDPALAAELTADPARPRAIVDEGPGLSGSSVGCVVEHLTGRGVAPSRIRLFPSHPNGPGGEASPRTRAAWSDSRCHVASFDDLALRPDARHGGLPGWVRDLVGDPLAALRDISGGRWRALPGRPESGWPPALAWQERRKFLVDTEAGTFLLKFAGLGRSGLAKLDRARALAGAGFSPEVLGLRHGFLVERWHAAAMPLDVSLPDRPALLVRLAEYIAFRACRFPSRRGAGADLARLTGMALHNVSEALGPEPAERLRENLAGAERWENHLRPVETDNRLHAWEWLQSGARLLKTDALDHHAGHDLVGDQDPVWDVAGGIVEFDLEAREAEELAARVGRDIGRELPPSLVELFIVYYRTFQLGYCEFGRASSPDASEQERFEACALRYLRPLRRQLV